jgi:hypothetical protein
MYHSARVALRYTIYATVCFLFGLVVFACWREIQTPPSDRLAYSQLYLEAFKVIVVSFFVALLAILLPARIREVHDNFEKLRESRVAYSMAKTGVAYLPIRLCALKFNEATAFIQEVHFHKHQAELYKELEQHVKHLDVTPEQWSEELFARLAAYRCVLEKQAHRWDSMNPGRRLEFLVKSREITIEEFKKKNKKSVF